MASSGVSASGQTVCNRPPALAAALKNHPTAQAWADLGNWYGGHNQFACAQSAFRSALRIDPQSPQLNYLLGLSLYGTKDFEAAVAPLQLSAQAAPHSLKTHLLLGSVYAQLSRPQLAIPEWQAALKIDANSSIALHGLTQSLLDANDDAGVVRLLQPRKKLDASLADSLAIAEYRTGNSKGAIQTASDALQAHPSSLHLARTLVVLYLKAALTDNAEVVARKSYELHPDSVAAQETYFQTLIVNGDWGPGVPLGRKLLAEAPHAFDTLYDNGVLESQQRQYAAAKEHLLAAAALRPKMADLRYHLGITLFHLNDYAGAKKQLELAIQLGATEPEAHFALAQSLSHLGDTAGARKQLVLYQQAVRDRENSTIVASKIAEAKVALQQKNFAHAVHILTEAFDAAPDNPALGYRLSSAQDQAGDYAGEAATLQKVIQLDPQSAQYHYLLGLAFCNLGHYQQAVAPLQESIRLDSSVIVSHLLLATVYGNLSEPQLAIPQWQAALAIDPNSTVALHGLTHSLFQTNDYEAVVALLQPRTNLDIDSVNNLAIAEYRTTRPLQAIETAEKGLERDPKSIALSRTLVLLDMKIARDDQAEAVAKRTYELLPNSVAAQSDYFQTLVQNQKWSLARPIGEKLLTEAPHDFETLYDNGMLDNQTGNYAEAKKYLTEAATLKPQMPDVHYRLGIALSHLQDYAGAKKEFEQAIQLGTQETEAYFQLAQTLGHLGDQAGARKELALYQQAVKNRQNKTLASTNAAEAAQAMEQKNYKYAIQLLTQAFNATPDNALVGYKLAVAQQAAGDTAAEQATLQKVVQDDPTFALAQYQLGYLESQVGDLTSAEKHFRQAVQDAPGYTQAWISLAAILATESKFTEAQSAAESALLLDPHNAEAQSLEKQIVAANQPATGK